MTQYQLYEFSFLTSLSVNLKIVKDNKLKGRRATSPSFFMSSNGLDLMGALLYNYQHYSQDDEWEQYRNEHISNIIDKAKL